jgi:hypothetical protein
MDCALDTFVPGTDTDPDPTRSFQFYRQQAYSNVRSAGDVIWSTAFKLTEAQIAKVDGEPRRVCRRPFRLSHAAMAGCCSMA